MEEEEDHLHLLLENETSWTVFSDNGLGCSEKFLLIRIRSAAAVASGVAVFPHRLLLVTGSSSSSSVPESVKMRREKGLE